jgi:PGF-pre-PGF domain-containing protein
MTTKSFKNLIAWQKERDLVVFVILFSIFYFLFSNFVFASITDGTIDSTHRYAWSENAGWINFGCTHCNVRITDSAITGFAWNENFGWINLNPTHGGITNDGEGDLAGFAWGENLGWINFDNVFINIDGRFTGTATGTISGRINFDCVHCNVRTNWRPRRVRPRPRRILEIRDIRITGVTENSAVIEWLTNLGSLSIVEYGLTQNYGFIQEQRREWAVNHRIVLSNLKPNTKYHFRIVAVEGHGQRVYSPNQTFRTLVEIVLPPIVPPLIEPPVIVEPPLIEPVPVEPVPVEPIDPIEPPIVEPPVIPPLIEIIEIPQDIIEIEEIVEVETVTAGIPVLFEIKETEISEVIIKTLQDKNNVLLRVQQLTEIPAEIPEIDNIYRYFSIVINVASEYIDYATIKFNVSTAWINRYNIDINSIKFNRFNTITGQWDMLPTEIIREDEDYIVFSAITPHFSVFAVTGKPIVPPVIVLPVEPPIEEPPVVEPPIEPPIEAEPLPLFKIIIGILFLIGVIVLILILLKKKKK